jgi:predicted transcriptional regulator
MKDKRKKWHETLHMGEDIVLPLKINVTFIMGSQAISKSKNDHITTFCRLPMQHDYTQVIVITMFVGICSINAQ